ncbi:hypothetical protein [Micromonospora avicenniae]|uniref:hypothetical protein n=1 Tax=Micromonospora avicenniae TaxID=1198245 RepID=UPI003318B279
MTMQILRDSQIAVTMNIYSEVASEATEKALKRLGGQFEPALGDGPPAVPVAPAKIRT